MSTEILVRAGSAQAVTLRSGQTLRIVNVEGKQVADFIGFSAVDLTEALSTVHTIRSAAT